MMTTATCLSTVFAVTFLFGSKVRIIVRADSGFARDAIMAWCEENGVLYCLGLAQDGPTRGATQGPF
jgi:hypothetical protein